MKRNVLQLLLLVALVLTTGFANAATLKALIVDGQNNHNWQGTTPVLKAQLEQTGLFDVDVATTPPSGQPMDSFKPDFTSYDVIVQNYTGDEWPEATKAAFETYMANGGGLIIYHAADNAFPKWDEFNKMIAVGGWGGRNETWGPMVRWRNGKMIFDYSKGSGGSHGPQWAYPVEMVDLEHPITRGMPPVWLQAADELYATMRGPAKNMHMLAVSKSRKTGEYEPILFTIKYGKGRVFHTVLGHDVTQISSAGFVITFQRGTEWAATGNVTQELPTILPSPDEVIFAPKPMSYDAVCNFDFGQDRNAMAAIEDNIRIGGKAIYPQIEDLLIRVLENDDATFRGKLFSCRMLRRMGSEKSIPSLAKMLSDDKLSDPARFALQLMVNDRVDAVFQEALDSLKGDLLIGVIGSIAERRDAGAVGKLTRFLQSDDPQLVNTTLAALGRIGSSRAAAVLGDVELADSYQMKKYDALLLCADALAKDGSATSASETYTQLRDADVPVMIRLAAYRGLLNLQQDQGVPIVMAMLASDEPEIQNAAAGPFSAMIPGKKMTTALADKVASLDPATQTTVLTTLANRGDTSSLPAVLKLVNSDNVSVQISAISALAKLGNASTVRLLIELAANETPVGKAASQSLTRISGPGIDAAIIDHLSFETSRILIAAVEALKNRGTKKAIPALTRKALDIDTPLREESLRALGVIAEERHLGDLFKVLANAFNSNDRSVISDIIIELTDKMEDKEQRTNLLLDTLQDAKPQMRVSVIQLLRNYGGDAAFEAVMQEVKNLNETVRKGAFNALTRWPDDSAYDYLISIASTTDSEGTRINALRGVVRALERPTKRSVEEILADYKRAMETAKSEDDKTVILEALGGRVDLETLSFLEAYLNDADAKAVARTAYKRILNKLQARDLDPSAMKATASHNNGGTQQAFDGNQNTRWETGTPQKPGMWFILDLGSPWQIETLILDSNQSAGDYPRGYEVYLSNDGETWSDCVAKSDDNKPVTIIPIDMVAGRFIKIVQTGKVDGLFWSIHELKVSVVSDTDALQEAIKKLEGLE